MIPKSPLRLDFIINTNVFVRMYLGESAHNLKFYVIFL